MVNSKALKSGSDEMGMRYWATSSTSVSLGILICEMEPILASISLGKEFDDSCTYRAQDHMQKTAVAQQMVVLFQPLSQESNLACSTCLSYPKHRIKSRKKMGFCQVFLTHPLQFLQLSLLSIPTFTKIVQVFINSQVFSYSHLGNSLFSKFYSHRPSCMPLPLKSPQVLTWSVNSFPTLCGSSA